MVSSVGVLVYFWFENVLLGVVWCCVVCLLIVCFYDVWCIYSCFLLDVWLNMVLMVGDLSVEDVFVYGFYGECVYNG